MISPFFKSAAVVLAKKAIVGVMNSASSIGHPPHSSASPVELRLRVGPRALSGKKKEVR
jgi:hypothetical protein